MRETYTDEQRTTAIGLRFRDHIRPCPWPVVAHSIGVPYRPTVVEKFLWAIVTGYPTNNEPDGPRRDAPVWPQGAEEARSGMPWHPAEQEALKNALGGDGQLRTPPVDVAYIAQVLARTPEEVDAQWKKQNADNLGRKGFF